MTSVCLAVHLGAAGVFERIHHGFFHAHLFQMSLGEAAPQNIEDGGGQILRGGYRLRKFRRAKMFASQGKCALRIRPRRKAANTRARIAAAAAGCDLPSKPVVIASTALLTISRNSISRRMASRIGDGNKSARFLVQPSRICAKLRYIRVRTASPP